MCLCGGESQWPSYPGLGSEREPETETGFVLSWDLDLDMGWWLVTEGASPGQ